jgi:tetrapyrrole methylase family protein / MazG family protein
VTEGYSPGRLLDLSVELFDLDISGGVQLWEAGALLAAARPAGLPAPGVAVSVDSYAATQGLGPYAPPPAPFPLAPAAFALVHGPPGADWPAVAALLATRYPADHAVRLAATDGDGASPQRAELPLAALADAPVARLHAGQDAPPPRLYLLLPPLPVAADLRGIDGLRWVMARLLGPGGCPWDVRQTHQSLRPALLEETYEVLEALDAGDMAGLGEELGDLLISVLAHSEMARQAGAFALEDVLAQVTAKLIGRHPHVFGELAVEGEGAVLRNWEQIKAAELAAKGRARASALDGIPPALPALATAQKLVKKASRTGFAWGELAQVWAKLREELDELAEAAASGDRAHTQEELGDVLFVLAELARWLELDAEVALRESNAKFRRRFTAVEAAAAARGRALSEHSLDELLALWDAAKRAP